MKSYFQLSESLLRIWRWPSKIIFHRRTIRILESAVISIEAIVDAVSESDSMKSNEHFELLNTEVVGVLDTLKRQLPSCNLDVCKSAFNQWKNIRANTNDGNLAKLLAFQRALESQHRALIAFAPAFPPKSLRTTNSPPSLEAEPKHRDVPESFEPNEDALLARLTERFYSSASFKALGIALVAAVLLAGTGTVFLGSHTSNLLNNLEAAESRGKEDINTSAKRILEAIDAQSKSLETSGELIDRKQKEFVDDLVAANDKINAEVESFTTKSDELREKAVRIAIAELEKELNDPMSELKKTIIEASNRIEPINRELNTLDERKKQTSSLVDKIEKSSIEADKNLETAAPLLARLNREMPQFEEIIKSYDTFDENLRKASKALEDANPTLQRINDVSPKLDTLTRELISIEARDKALSDALETAKERAIDADLQAKAAKQSASLAENARIAAMTTVASATEKAANQQFDLGGTRTHIESLKRALEDTETELRKTGSVALNSDTFNQQISTLANQVREMDVRLQRFEQLDKSPALGFPKSQAKLSRQQLLEIQLNLATRGFSPGKVDGLLGNNTRKAVREFQKANSEPVTGTLTAAQIKLLLTPP